MTTASWLLRAKTQLGNLMQATTAPILVHGHQPKGLYELVGQHLAELLCETPAGKKPCLQCPGCHMRLAGNHPDLRYLMPQAVGLELGFNVEVKTGVKPSQDIRIDDVRDLQNYFNTASSRGASRYVVVYPFDNMNANTANALLKTLEEPANGLRFVLVGSRVDKLLPTIRSRCQELTMPMPAIAECLAWLEAQGVQQPDVALGVAMNDPFEALGLAQTSADQLDLRKKFLEWLANPDQHANPPAGLEKVGLPVVLELAMRLCSDCVAQAHGLKGNNFPWLAPKLMWVKSIGVERSASCIKICRRNFVWRIILLTPVWR
ncbi:DNA-directed DNA polymerase [Limnobacter sp. MED105]|uniref:DNA-directed DNA polymerase n=1 Tax=Limnobacter sp. MED105 TaxID=391597 RepID=UPI000156D079|nr:DNA-directed DNA polymerase [Limnobacter sp. MED105]EDM84055.1 DNA-directed DNA polymerase [Limnobacter sp. MED105]